MVVLDVISYQCRKEFTREELLQFHIYNMMGLEMRYEFATKVHGRPVESAVYIADMKGYEIYNDAFIIVTVYVLLFTILFVFFCLKLNCFFRCGCHMVHEEHDYY